MRIFWIIRLRVYSLFLGSAKLLGYIGKPIFIKGWKKIFIGKDARIFPGARFEVLGKGSIHIGDHVRSGQNLLLTTTDRSIKIGKYSILSANIFMGTQKSNLFDNREDYDSAWFNADVSEMSVVIGERCFIGYGAVILPGTRLGKCCVVGANAVVKGDFPDNTVIASPKFNILDL